MKLNQWKSLYNEMKLTSDDAYFFKIDLTEILHLPLKEHISLQFLNESELNKFIKYRFNKDKNRFAIARLAVKKILSEYLNCQPDKIKISIDNFGKPQVENFSNIHFNISHSGNFIAIAFGLNPIGIDIEVYNKEINHLELSDTVFSKLELDQIRKIKSDELIDGFYRCWTKKEAFMKAIGKGFYAPLKEFSVRISDEGEYNLLDVKWDLHAKNSWKCFNITFNKDYGAACCLNKFVSNYNFYDLTQDLLQKIV